MVGLEPVAARQDLGAREMAVLAMIGATAGDERAVRFGDRARLAHLGLDQAAVEGCCQRLTAACAVVPVPKSATGYRISLIGLAKLHRFLRAPMGALADVRLDAEAQVRRLALEALGPEEREALETRMCAELVELREGVFRCAHAALCEGKGCPLAASFAVEEIDRAIIALMPEAPLPDARGATGRSTRRGAH